MSSRRFNPDRLYKVPSSGTFAADQALSEASYKHFGVRAKRHNPLSKTGSSITIKPSGAAKPRRGLKAIEG